MSRKRKSPKAPQGFFAEDSLVKTSAWLDAVLDWLEKDPDYSLSSRELLRKSVPGTSWSRMSPVYCRTTTDETCPASSERWGNSGMGGLTGYLTLNTSEFPSNAVECLLSEVLEELPTASKYSLSPKACRGILRRAAKKGWKLPPLLLQALRSVAESTAPEGGGKTM